MNRVTENKNKLLSLLPSPVPADHTGWEESNLISESPVSPRGVQIPFSWVTGQILGGDHAQRKPVWIALVGNSSPWIHSS